jgi:hypothetical protein
MPSPWPMGLDFRGFAIGQEPGKIQGRMNTARHLMSGAGNNAEWPTGAKKVPKINSFVFC